MNAIRTSLSRAPSEPTSQEALEQMARDAWLKRGFVAIRPAEITDDWLRQALVNFATKRWGKRHANGGSGGAKAG